MTSRTFAILKPDVTRARVVGAVLTMAENAGFRIVAMRMLQLDEAQIEFLYQEHIGKPFFTDKHDGPDAIDRWRALMGPTDAAKAPPGTVRYMFAARRSGTMYDSPPRDSNSPIFMNAVHGSDSPEAYQREMPHFFEVWHFTGTNLEPIL